MERARPSNENARDRNRVRRWAAFLKEFIRSPRDIGAVAPSSRRLAAAMLRDLDLKSAHAVVEYGPGTGIFTRAVLDELGPRWLADGEPPRRFVAIEHNRKMVDMLRADHPEVTVVHDSAANVIEVCRNSGIAPGTVDCIVSGLGWASFTDALRTEILEATAKVLKPGGRFHTFAYQTGFLIPGSWHFRSEIKRLFSEVRTGRVVWGNLPPAFVYQCVK